MGAKNKLGKFAELGRLPHVYEYPYRRVVAEGCALAGRWGEEVFKNGHPIVVELGCGRGEYTVGLGGSVGEKNYIGVDIKGARMWRGAKESLSRGLGNVAFLRTEIELIDRFFVLGEVSEIWLTFPDPQMKKVGKRLTSSRFMELYRRILVAGGLIHLKTDSGFLYAYTRALALANGCELLYDESDVYGGEGSPLPYPIREIRTYYEEQWLCRGLSIKYLGFRCPGKGELVEPAGEFEADSYRSYGRQGPVV
ncbi:MAG: tRNA (guanosine(46)-N7)-methyltransferase TrmB [Tannerellaceae bacterium]|jgi:tRNA (guanine-N7-)-methyltransferase|nr:tRNA (guanosine(46)-N7)-methyltransferase TrmB [Tannerellaceae bacterium]